MSIFRIFENLGVEASRYGGMRALGRFLAYAVNKVLHVRRLEVMQLTRKRLAPLDLARYKNITSRLATADDILKMRGEGTWDLTDALLKGFHEGDSCLLSFIDEKLAGYTWVHVGGRPEILPGLRLSIPADYVYNFAGFTHPDFRGCGLQPYRHQEILNRPEWRNKAGMIGYVDATNWSSKKGQSKSGYQPLGTLTLFGSNDHFAVLLSAELTKFGIRRIDV